ncbi:MAG TPA: DNA primase [Saprospiraceae bacterium]|nr:DNA primase [Saprospiraceae bacterium]HMP23330.1 DNA primase [Saprospiraceae bacterium]
MISQRSVQEVLDTVKVEDIVGDYVNLKRRGTNLIGLCPFHNEKTPSFSVSPSKGIYKCFGCGQGGNAVQFLMEHEQFTFPEAIRHLAQRYNIKLEETETSLEAIQEKQLADSLYIINEYAKKFYAEQLFLTDRGKSVGLSYFKQRGFHEETIRKFGLGFASEKRDAFTLRAINDGHNIELLRKLGLTTQYDTDFFRDRVMFTIHNLSGKEVAFAGRILNKDAKAPKYINSPETDIYNKSKTLYGLFFAKKAIRDADECILVEGYTDVISLHQSGIENVVASSGTSLTVEQIRLIKRYTPQVKVLYDGDVAGVKAALRGLDLLLEQDMNVKIVLLPDKEDPDSYLTRVGSAAFQAYITDAAKDFITFKTDLLLKDAGNDPVKKAALVKDIVASIGKIPDPVKRAFFTQECARMMGLDEQLLVQETNKVLIQTLKKRQQREDAQPRPSEKAEEGLISVSEADPVAPTNAPTAAAVGDEFQERDIARILVLAGGEIFDEATQLTVAEYVIGSIEDVIESFDHALYQRIVLEARSQLLNKLPLDAQFFLRHADPAISQLAVSLSASPYEFSENWEKRWEIYLNQKTPEQNFLKDSAQALQRFKLRKIMRLCAQNLQRITELSQSQDADQLMAHLKVQQRLNDMRNALAKELGTVVL